MTTENFPPNFAYVNTKDDCIPIDIDGFEERDRLIAMKGDKDALFAWVSENTCENGPTRDEITGIDVELYDNEGDALAGGNETTEVWN